MSVFSGKKPTHASAMRLFSQARTELEAAHAHNQAEKAELTQKMAVVVEEETAISKSLSFFESLFGTKSPETTQETSTNA